MKRFAWGTMVLLVAGAIAGCGGGSSATGGPGHGGKGGGAGGIGGVAGGPAGGSAAGHGVGGSTSAAGGAVGAAGAIGVAGSSGAAGAVAGGNGAAGAVAGGNGAAGAVAGSSGAAGAVAGSNGAAGAVAGSSGAAGAVAGSNGTAGGASAGSGGNSLTRAGCDPTWVTYDFTGTVIDGWAGTPPKISPGDPVIGYYCFDPTTVKAFADPGSTLYYFDLGTNLTFDLPPPALFFSLTVRDFRLTIDPELQSSSITVTDREGGDVYLLHPRDLMVNGKRTQNAIADLTAGATDGAALTSTELVVDSLDPARFDRRTITIFIPDGAYAVNARWDAVTRLR